MKLISRKELIRLELNSLVMGLTFLTMAPVSEEVISIISKLGMPLLCLPRRTAERSVNLISTLVQMEILLNKQEALTSLLMTSGEALEPKRELTRSMKLRLNMNKSQCPRSSGSRRLKTKLLISEWNIKKKYLINSCH